MSIHMHDLQVQNKITSKNEIETKKLIVSDEATIEKATINEFTVPIKGPIPEGKAQHQLKVEGQLVVTNYLKAPTVYADNLKMLNTDDKLVMLNVGYITTSKEDQTKKYGYITTEGDGVCIEAKEFSFIYGNDHECVLAWDSDTHDLVINNSITIENTITANNIAITNACFINDENVTQKTFKIGTQNPYFWGGEIDINKLATDLAGSENLKAPSLNTPNGVGDFSQPIYFDTDGKPQPCSSIIATKLADDISVGNEVKPVYFENGIPKVCNYVENAVLADEAEYAREAHEAHEAFKLIIPTNASNEPPSDPQQGQVFFKIDYESNNKIQVEDGDWVPATPYIYIPR